MTDDLIEDQEFNWGAAHDDEPRSHGNFGLDVYQQEDQKRQEARSEAAAASGREIGVGPPSDAS